MKDGAKGSKLECFIDKKPKDEKLKNEPCHKVSITALYQNIHILEVPSKTTKVTMTFNLATKIYAIAIKPCNREKNAAL